MDQMERERQITGDLHGALISKPRGRPIEDAFVVMRLGDWVDWLVERSQERPSPCPALAQGQRPADGQRTRTTGQTPSPSCRALLPHGAAPGCWPPHALRRAGRLAWGSVVATGRTERTPGKGTQRVWKYLWRRHSLAMPRRGVSAVVVVAAHRHRRQSEKHSGQTTSSVEAMPTMGALSGIPPIDP
jgi:hypothetical protein